MDELVLKDRDGKEIVDWREWSPPKKDSHWRAGRSAMELARSWFVSPKPVCPAEIADLIGSHSRTKDVRLHSGIPEYVTRLPERGEGRNHDLLLMGSCPGGKVVVSVEAKVDESFGETIGSYWSKARRAKEPTRVPERIEALLSLVFGSSARPDIEPWQGLRYQLLTAVAGTAIEASREQADMAIVVVHELRTEDLNPENLAANADDLRRFISVLIPVPGSEVVDGRLYGPAILEPSEYLPRRVELLIGKAVFDWQAAGGDGKV